jgi:hypothetical protein
MTDRHVQRVEWFRRDPGGSTVFALSDDPEQVDDLRAQQREELGLEPEESDPSKALGVVLLIFAAAVVFGIAAAVWVLWR